MTALSYALTTVTAVKLLLGLADTTHDTLLTTLINAATEGLEKQMHRRIKKTEHTEYLDGGGKNIILGNFPVLDTTTTPAATADPVIKLVAVDDTEDTFDADGYRILNDRGIVYRPVGWPRGEVNIKATYEAGFDSIPADIDHACADVVVRIFNTRKSSGIKSEQIGAYSVTYEDVNSAVQASPFAQKVISLYATPLV